MTSSAALQLSRGLARVSEGPGLSRALALACRTWRVSSLGLCVLRTALDSPSQALCRQMSRKALGRRVAESAGQSAGATASAGEPRRPVPCPLHNSPRGRQAGGPATCHFMGLLLCKPLPVLGPLPGSTPAKAAWPLARTLGNPVAELRGGTGPLALAPPHGLPVLQPSPARPLWGAGAVGAPALAQRRGSKPLSLSGVGKAQQQPCTGPGDQMR